MSHERTWKKSSRASVLLNSRAHNLLWRANSRSLVQQFIAARTFLHVLSCDNLLSHAHFPATIYCRQITRIINYARGRKVRAIINYRTRDLVGAQPPDLSCSNLLQHALSRDNLLSPNSVKIPLNIKFCESTICASRVQIPAFARMELKLERA